MGLGTIVLGISALAVVAYFIITNKGIVEKNLGSLLGNFSFNFGSGANVSSSPKPISSPTLTQLVTGKSPTNSPMTQSASVQSKVAQSAPKTNLPPAVSSVSSINTQHVLSKITHLHQSISNPSPPPNTATKNVSINSRAISKIKQLHSGAMFI